MFDLAKIKGIIFDYGGTIDSNGRHWAWVIWDAYQDNLVLIDKEQFKDAYVYAERYLATNKVIMPEDNFYILMLKKVELQLSYLSDKELLTVEKDKIKEYNIEIAQQCYNFAKNIINREITILSALKKRYPMVLVSNFYGNIQSVLEDFGLINFFDTIIESAVVGIRKPDPAIFKLGIDRLGLPAESIVIIGDSYDKDILPAIKNGSQTIWLQGEGWEDTLLEKEGASVVIKDFEELKSIFQLS